MEVARAKPHAPRPSASVMLRRGDEILVCHRVSTVPSFPDYWAFPGGGVSRTDRAALEGHPEWFADRDQDERVALVALMREMIEEVGIVPSPNGLKHIENENNIHKHDMQTNKKKKSQRANRQRTKKLTRCRQFYKHSQTNKLTRTMTKTDLDIQNTFRQKKHARTMKTVKQGRSKTKN